jgi:hypothetical protein
MKIVINTNSKNNNAIKFVLFFLNIHVEHHPCVDKTGAGTRAGIGTGAGIRTGAGIGTWARAALCNGSGSTKMMRLLTAPAQQHWQ